MLRLGATAALFILAVCLGFPRDATAATPWVQMHANTYDATPASVRSQCGRELAAGHVPGLTAAKCALLEHKLNTGDYDPSVSSHGQPYHSIAGVGADRVQQLGFEPRVLSVDLGDGVVAHWFTGEERSCNNIGFVKGYSRVETNFTTFEPGMQFTAPPFVVPLCNCGRTIVLPGSSGGVPDTTIRSRRWSYE